MTWEGEPMGETCKLTLVLLGLDSRSDLSKERADGLGASPLRPHHVARDGPAAGHVVDGY